MKILRSISEFHQWRQNQVKPIHFVPTMGALHEGHRSLLMRAKSDHEANPEQGLVVLSIFVNPTQFNDPNDLKNYPSTWDADVEMAQAAGVDVLFAPQFSDIYPDQYRYFISENHWSQILCGATRPGHFNGVLTVVMKLMQIVQPKKAYFGEKDYQQLMLVQQMISAFFMNIEIVGVPTVRESSGLALSSRNTRLSPEGRDKARWIYYHLKNSKTTNEASEKLLQLGFQIDYLEEHWGRRFAAVFIEGVRLIDNVAI